MLRANVKLKSLPVLPIDTSAPLGGIRTKADYQQTTRCHIERVQLVEWSYGLVLKLNGIRADATSIILKEA
jgi:hypothetical protein